MEDRRTHDDGDGDGGEMEAGRRNSDSDATATDVEMVDDQTPTDVVDHPGNIMPPTATLYFLPCRIFIIRFISQNTSQIKQIDVLKCLTI